MIRWICMFLSCVSVCEAQTADEIEVAAQVEKLRQVMIKPDKAVLESLAAEELSYGHSSGMIEDKAAFVNEFVEGHSVFTAMTLEDQTIKIAGDAAIVRHRLLGDSFNQNTAGKIDIIILMVWQKQEGVWKLLARQAAKIPPEYVRH
ncbi:MAG TPA: nuclear transport factor 2 family protein [Cyclobacteriaceae bacterium]|nr:nuclear transport factor 2 family protein [Cyclobacteriaceae bacterium]